MDLNLEALKEEQLKLAKRITLSDYFDKVETVGGCDIAYTGNKVISCISVCDIETMRLRETKYTVGNVEFPYIPGFLSYREAPITVETYHKLEIDPDILIVDGNGILHPRLFGVASHLGLLLDKPSIGVAKELLCGEVKGDTVYVGKDVVGKIIETKEKARPIFISPGHKISLQSAVDIAKRSLREHKLPEPLHQAHKMATKLRNRLRDEAASRER